MFKAVIMCQNFVVYGWLSVPVIDVTDRQMGHAERKGCKLLRPKQDPRHFADGVFKIIPLSENCWLKF